MQYISTRTSKNFVLQSNIKCYVPVIIDKVVLQYLIQFSYIKYNSVIIDCKYGQIWSIYRNIEK